MSEKNGSRSGSQQKLNSSSSKTNLSKSFTNVQSRKGSNSNLIGGGSNRGSSNNIAAVSKSNSGSKSNLSKGSISNLAKGGSSSALAATDNSNYNGDASTVVVDQQRTSLTSTTSQSPPSATAADADQQPLSSSSDETTSNLGGAKSNVNLLSSSSSNNNNFSSPSTAADGFSSSANGNELAAQNQLVPHSSASNLLESLDHSNIQGDIIERGQDYEFLNGDEYEPEPAARVLASPVPELNEGFIFMNVDYEADPDTPVIALATALSRSASLDDVGAAASSLAATLDGSSTPLLRPSTPDKLELQRDAANHHGTHQMDGGDSSFHGQHGQTSTIANTTTAAGGAGNAGRSSFANDSIALESVPVYDREALILSIRQELDIKEKHSSKNLTLQNKLGDYFKKKRTDDARDGEKSVSDQEQRYANCMNTLAELSKEFEAINAQNQKTVNEYKAKLQEREDEASVKSKEFSQFKRKVTLEAINSRTGSSLPPKVIDQMDVTEQRKEAEVVAVRLENIKLRNRLKRDEQLLRQKEELADGLHMIDFEQLKIENQTYNEKIEERNEELLKLKKKITNIVQVLTHVKEKLQFVQTENVELKSELSELDDQVAVNRDSLPAAKQERDNLRSNIISLRHKNGLLGNVPLLQDFEEKVEGSDGLVQKIDDLREQHAALAAETLKIKRKIQRSQI